MKRMLSSPYRCTWAKLLCCVSRPSLPWPLLPPHAHHTLPRLLITQAGTPANDQKNVFGLCFTLRAFAAAMSPNPELQRPFMAPLRINDGSVFYSFTTNNYKLHFFESPSGIKIIMNTSANVGDCREALQYIYDSLLCELVIKNPLYVPGHPFESELFTTKLNLFIASSGL